MAAKKERFDLEKQTLNLFKGDFRRMQELYPRTGANKLIRELVHRHVKMAEELAQKNMPMLEQLDINLEAKE